LIFSSLFRTNSRWYNPETNCSFFDSISLGFRLAPSPRNWPFLSFSILCAVVKVHIQCPLPSPDLACTLVLALSRVKLGTLTYQDYFQTLKTIQSIFTQVRRISTMIPDALRLCVPL
jgi:hypothetical protein